MTEAECDQVVATMNRPNYNWFTQNSGAKCAVCGDYASYFICSVVYPPVEQTKSVDLCVKHMSRYTDKFDEGNR